MWLGGGGDLVADDEPTMRLLCRVNLKSDAVEVIEAACRSGLWLTSAYVSRTQLSSFCSVFSCGYTKLTEGV